MKQLCVFASLIIFTSCSFFIKKAGGIKNPRIESVPSLTIYAKSLGIDSADLVFAKDSAAISYINNEFHGTPEILVFDNQKHYYPYKSDSISCNATIDNVIDSICFINSRLKTTKRNANYDLLISKLSDPYHSLKATDLSEYDYILFFNFVSYFYGVNKTHLIPWTALIKNTKSQCKVKYVFINFDYLNTWDLRKKDLPKIKIKL